MSAQEAETQTNRDREILDGLRSGKPAAADALVARYAGPLVKYFSANLDDGSQAEDLCQEVFLRLLSMIQRTPHMQVQSLPSLLFTMARNLVLDTARKNRRTIKAESLNSDPASEEGEMGPTMIQVADPGPSPRDLAESRRRQEILQQALRLLPPDMREIVILRHVEGLDGKQISRMLGIPEGTAWSRIGRALQELRKILHQLESNTAPTPLSVPKGGNR